jgi:hypothetical protein
MRLALPITAILLALALAQTAQAATFGAVGGLRNPAAGVLDLSVQAVETEGVGLRRVTALLGGNTLDSAFFADPDCTPGACPAVGLVTLRVPTSGVPDGERRLEVIVEDGTGTVTHVIDQPITIANTPPKNTSTVTVNVGAGAKSPQPGPGGPGPGAGGQGENGCRSPRLSMFLAQRPLRFKRGVPVLVRRRNYRFRGRLTCLVNGKRKAAPRGMLVGVRDRVRGRTVVRAAARVRAGGRLVVKIAHRRSCTVVFRIRGAGGRLVSVRIPIRVVQRKGARS